MLAALGFECEPNTNSGLAVLRKVFRIVYFLSHLYLYPCHNGSGHGIHREVLGLYALPEFTSMGLHESVDILESRCKYPQIPDLRLFP